MTGRLKEVLNLGGANPASAPLPTPPAIDTQPSQQDFVASLPHALQRRTPEERERFARAVTEFFRKKIAGRSYKQMLEDGQYWQDALAEHGATDTPVQDLSARNLGNLRASIKNLSPEEEVFLAAAKESTYVATHSTSADVVNPQTGEAEIYSRKKLQTKGIPFDLSHTDKIRFESARI